MCLEGVVATVLDRCGCDLPAPLGQNRLDGHSLVPHLQGAGSAVRDRLHGECGQYVYVIDGRWELFWFKDTNEEQVFDLVADPQECCDCTADCLQLDVLREHLQEYFSDRDDVDYDPSACVPCAGRPPLSLWGDRVD